MFNKIKDVISLLVVWTGVFIFFGIVLWFLKALWGFSGLFGQLITILLVGYTAIIIIYAIIRADKIVSAEHHQVEDELKYMESYRKYMEPILVSILGGVYVKHMTIQRGDTVHFSDYAFINRKGIFLVNCCWFFTPYKRSLDVTFDAQGEEQLARLEIERDSKHYIIDARTNPVYSAKRMKNLLLTAREELSEITDIYNIACIGGAKIGYTALGRKQTSSVNMFGTEELAILKKGMSDDKITKDVKELAGAINRLPNILSQNDINYIKRLLQIPMHV